MSYFGEVVAEPPEDIVQKKLEDIAKRDAEKKTKSSSLSRRRNEGSSTEMTTIRFGKFNSVITSDSKQQAEASKVSSDNPGDSTFENALTKSLREENSKPSASSSMDTNQENQMTRDMIIISDEQIDNKHFTAVTGLIIDWSPVFWKRDFLPHRRISLKWSSTLEKFAGSDRKEDVITISGNHFWDIFKTKPEDRYFLSNPLQELHIFRQNYKSYTPFIITAKGNSDLPFPVSIVSQCDQGSDGISAITDACNQKIKRSAIGDMYPVMCDIYPSSIPGKEVIVTDFRNAFSLDNLKTAFFMNVDKMRDSMREIHVTATKSIINIREGSVLQQVIEALSVVQTPTFESIRLVACQVVIQMNNASKQYFMGEDTLWFMNIPSENIHYIINFVENLSNSIPRYKNFSLKLVPEGNAKWTDASLWSRRYMRESGLENVPLPKTSDEKTSSTSNGDNNAVAMLAKRIVFNVWLDLTIYFI